MTRPRYPARMIPTKPVSLDVRLEWLILQTGTVTSPADRRLNAIENLLAELTKQWRRPEPIDVGREVRLSPPTLRELCSWLSKRGDPDRRTAEWLKLYSSARDDLVPDGWLRMLFTEQGQRCMFANISAGHYL